MSLHNLSEEEFEALKTRVRRAQPERACRPRHDVAVRTKASSPSFHYQLALTGQLPSGKNQVQLLWRNGKVHRYPNKTFTNWRVKAGMELLEQPRPTTPLSDPIRLTVDYWPSNRIVRDVSGQLDALFSLLVYAHILKNDGLIYDVTWRRHELNTKFPKVVMEVEKWE